MSLLYIKAGVHVLSTSRTFSAINTVHQVPALLFDPLLHPLTPHAKVSERGQGKAAQLLPPLSVADGQAWGMRGLTGYWGKKAIKGMLSLST